MGRKPNALKTENTKPSLEMSGPPPGNPNPHSPALNCQNHTVEVMVQHNERTSTYKRKYTKHNTNSVRRSQRIKTASGHSSNHENGTYDEVITFVDNEKGEPSTEIEKVLLEPEPNVMGKSVEENFKCILQRLEACEKNINTLQSKMDNNGGMDGTPTSPSPIYEAMYLDSQKKIEELTNEKQRLSGKLENALGKVEVLESQCSILKDLVEKMKDIVMVCSLTKSTEAAVNLSTQAIHNSCAASAAKRKKDVQQR